MKVVLSRTVCRPVALSNRGIHSHPPNKRTTDLNGYAVCFVCASPTSERRCPTSEPLSSRFLSPGGGSEESRRDLQSKVADIHLFPEGLNRDLGGQRTLQLNLRKPQDTTIYLKLFSGMFILPSMFCQNSATFRHVYITNDETVC
jgi:hypothetical protein